MSGAAQLPSPRLVVYDAATGDPLVGGFVYTYEPGGSTPATTWQDATETTPNDNPIVLDSAGSCLIYGSGEYQLTVTDALGNAVPGYSGVTYSPPYISPAMIGVVGAATVEEAFDLIAVNGGTIGAAVDVLGNLNVADTLTAGSASLTTPLAVTSGGIGGNSLDANYVLTGQGASPISGIAPGAANTALCSNGTEWAPSAVVNSITGAGEVSVSSPTGNLTISVNPAAFLAVNSYLWARYNVAATPAAGTTYAGSTLYNNATGASFSAAGTWLCMGAQLAYEAPTCCAPALYATALFLRIA